MATDRIQAALDCERTWDEHIRRLPDDVSRSRFVRYSPELLGKLPNLDDVYSLDTLQVEVRKDLEKNASMFRNLAMQLVATSFYFETEKVQESAQNTATIIGNVYSSNRNRLS